MTPPAGHHLAEFNFGTLRHDWDDPRLADFVAGLDVVYRIAESSPGYVWRLTDEGPAAQSSPEAGNDRLASTLSVWQDAASLGHFVWNTLHGQFLTRKAKWYDAGGNGNLVLWWVPIGHRPSFSEGMQRWHTLMSNGDSPLAFGWTYLTMEPERFIQYDPTAEKTDGATDPPD